MNIQISPEQWAAHHWAIYANHRVVHQAAAQGTTAIVRAGDAGQYSSRGGNGVRIEHAVAETSRQHS